MGISMAAWSDELEEDGRKKVGTGTKTPGGGEVVVGIFGGVWVC